jgi:polysaccharide biosynthesis protein PelA
MGRVLRMLVCLLSAGFACLRPGPADADTPADTAAPLRSIAFYYGPHPPVAELSQYDAAVVEPDHGFVPPAPSAQAAADADGSAHAATVWYAYVSIGEVHASRAYYSAMPAAWLHGANDVWQSSIVDQTSKGWPEFVVNTMIAPLWRAGYRGFFLDTLDSYQLVATTDAARAAQQAGLVAVIRAIHTRFPGAYLILNRGFELLPEVHDIVDAVAFESLFHGWDQKNQRYIDVSAADRDWLLAQAKIVRDRYALPVISIDYCDSADRVCAADAIAKIRGLGLIPYIGDGGLQSVGSGAHGR